MNSNIKNKKFNIKQDKFLKFVYSFFGNLFFVYCTVFAFALIIFSTTTIECLVCGDSMKPTYNLEKDFQDTVFVNKYNKNYNYGDIVVINTDSEMVIKRIVGLPGDLVDIVFYNNHYVLKRNGKIIEENYLFDHGISEGSLTRNGMNKSFENFENFKKTCDINKITRNGEFLVGLDELFVMGDNRAVSLDSSSRGPFKLDNVVGIVENVKRWNENNFHFYYNYLMKGEFINTLFNIF